MTTRMRLERAAAAAIDAMLVLRSIANEAPPSPEAAHVISVAGGEAEELAAFCRAWGRAPRPAEPPAEVLRLSA